MEAAAILAAPAVNVENRPPAGSVPATGDFKAVLRQQVNGETTGTTVSDPAQQEIQAATQAEASVLPAVDGLMELLAAAGYQQGTDAVKAEDKIDPAGASETTLSSDKAAEMLAVNGIAPVEVTAAMEDAQNGKLTVDIGSAAKAEMLAVNGIAPVEVTAATEDAQNGKLTVDIGSAAKAEVTGRAGNPGNAEIAGVSYFSGPPTNMQKANVNDISFAAQLPVEVLAVLQSASPTQAGFNPINTVRALQIPGELNQKLAALVSKFAAGEDITKELGVLIKNFGTTPVIKEIRKMLVGLTGNGTDAIDKFQDAISAESGKNLVVSVEKAAVKGSDNPAEAAKEPAGTPVQQITGVNETSGRLAHNTGQGAGETGNVPVQAPNVEQTTARFVVQQPTETVKTPVNNFARWTADILGKIGEKAKLVIGSGQSEMQIQLKPDFLGKINLQVTMENGQVTARIGVENMQVKELVEANLKQLQQNLDSQGIKVNNLVVDLSANRNFHHFNRPHDFGTGKAVRGKATGANEGYGGLPADDKITQIRWSDTNSTVDYIA